MSRAAKNRTVASTKMNAVSSRSHCVFTLYITGTARRLASASVSFSTDTWQTRVMTLCGAGKNRTRGVQVTGSLNLVDLAGSERLARSQVRPRPSPDVW